MKADNSISDNKLSRRAWNHLALLLFPVVYGAAFLAGAIRYLCPLPAKKRLAELALAVSKEEILAGRVLRLEFNGRDVFVLGADDRQVVVKKAVCPHLKCNVNWDEKSDRFVCPCHGMTFHRDGTWIQGPTERDLSDQLFKETEDGKIVLLDDGEVG